MKKSHNSLKKLLSLIVALAIFLSGYSLIFMVTEAVDIPSDDEEYTTLYIDCNLLCNGETASGFVSAPTKLSVNGNSFEILSLTEDEKSLLEADSLFINDYIYKIEVDSDSFQSLKENPNIQLQADFKTKKSVSSTSSKTFPIGQSDLSGPKTYTTKLPVNMPEDLTFPCLFLSSYTTALSYLNGYWSELGEVNTIGYNQYEVQKLEMGYNSKYKLSKPETSIQVQGKVYDYYDDADLNGAPKTIKNSGNPVGTWDAYYYKFNDALSEYYKSGNLEYYDHYNSFLHDTKPVEGSLYSQSFGITDPFYLGYIEKTNNPIKQKSTTYGLFGFDNSSNYDSVNKVTINAKDRLAAITSSNITIANRSVTPFSAYQGIVADKLGENGEIMAKTVDPDNQFGGVVLPFFNEDFLNGDNSLHTALGKVFDATYMFDRTEKTTVDGKRVYTYSLAQDTRCFLNEDGTLDSELHKNNSKTSGICKELMPLNFMINNQEYTNPGYAQRIDVPFVLPDDGEEYTMTVQGDDCVWIYLDGELIIDLGGLNYVYNSNHIEGTINFTEGFSKVNNVRTTTTVVHNVINEFNVNDGQRHELTIVQIDNYTGEGCVLVETNLPLEYVIPQEGEPKSSYEIENKFSAPEMTNNLSSFIDSLDFKNSIFVDAPHKAGEMDIIPTGSVSLFNSYSGGYQDRKYYEQNDNWEYVDSEAVLNRQADIELGNKQTYAALGLIYSKDSEIESNAFQTSSYKKTVLKINDEDKDLTNLFNTSVSHYRGSGLYSYSQFLLGTTTDKYKRLQLYQSSDSKIPSMNYLGNKFGNFAWTNKTLVESKMKTGSFTISKEVNNNPFQFMMNKKFTFKIYYLNVDDVFGTLPAQHDTYNGQDCIVDTVTLEDGESKTFNVPEGVHCIITELDENDYDNITQGDNGNYYNFSVTEGQSKQCSFTNEYIGNYSETKDMTVNIQWIDGSNRLNTRPAFSTLTPFDTYKTTQSARSKAITYVVFKGKDNKWHKLSDAVNSTKSADIYNQFAGLIKSDVTSGDTNAVKVSNLPKYALPYLSSNVGASILPEGSEMQYGLLQLKYGEYVVTPLNNTLGGGVQPDGETIVDTLYGSITVNKYGISAHMEKHKLDGIEFKLYSTEDDAKTDEHSIETFETSNGTGVVSQLAAGTYWLAETKTVDGYEIFNEPVEIEISYESTATLNRVIELENKRMERDVKITKQVDMTYGNIPSDIYKNQSFDFRVVLSLLNPDTTYTVEYSKVGSTETETKTFDSDAEGKLNIEIQLKDSESVTIKDLPRDATYQITEMAVKDYISSYTVQHNQTAHIEKTQDTNTAENQSLTTALEKVEVDNQIDDSDIEFVFKNTYTFDPYVLPNSGMEDSIPIIIAGIIGFVFFGMLYVGVNLKKKNTIKK